jgi:hypothetical protein
MVVKHDGVATAAGLAGASEATPDRGDRNRSQDRCTRCLVKDLIAFVHYLNVLSQPYGAVGIGRRAVAYDTWKRDTVKIEDGSGHDVRDQKLQHRTVVDDRVRKVHMQGKGQLGVQIGFAHFFIPVLRRRRWPEHGKIA